MPAGPAGDAGLAGQVRRGLAWSGLNSVALRIGSLLTGIVLARLLAPEDFGVYAIALTAQAVLVTLADLGLSADLVRAERPEQRAPTVATIALLAGSTLTVLMVVSAVPLATALGSAEAAPVIAVLAFTLVLSGAGVVPYAKLQRGFEQRKLFLVDGCGFVVSTGLSICLVLLGSGPMALAWARLAAQVVVVVLQFVLARTRPRLGWDRVVARSAMRFGVPIALANTLSWALLNVDTVVVARLAGPVVLGFYVLAFNVSSWPMSAIGQAIRPVTLAAFARRQDGDASESVARAVGLAAAVAFPAGTLLAVLALPVVTVVYGERWAAAAAALAALGVFGGLRVVTDVLATFLTARGAARAVLTVQVVWIVALVPAMVLGTTSAGLAGAGWAHVVVAAALVLPAYLVASHRAGARAGAVLGSLWRPALASAGMAVPVLLVSRQADHPLGAVLLGGMVGVAAYAALVVPWVRRLLAPAAAAAAVPGTAPDRLPVASS
ncbi:oligosaccharide flippase family protein [Geodermatophilus obscurus]|uniref:oligosaccharide flippase family protein n=1 Tax=Geodermatophilus obscurus TaxID=1861 RepID=UPI000944BA2D|nr:oligosaccharide flippase family protein [Geodermatophilus obscurus]